MNNAFLTRKSFVSGLVDVLNMAIANVRLDDADTVLAALRILRPKLAEIDTFEAWILIKRKRWEDALRTLRALESTAPNWSLGRAMLAFCQFALNDKDWENTAHRVMDSNPTPEAANLIHMLRTDGKGDSLLPAEPAAEAPAVPAFDSSSFYGGHFMRA